MDEKSLEERYRRALELVAELETELAVQRREGANVFLNFHDKRGLKADETKKTVDEMVERLPAGQRVVLVVSKADFGKVSIPLSMAAGEVIS